MFTRIKRFVRWIMPKVAVATVAVVVVPAAVYISIHATAWLFSLVGITFAIAIAHDSIAGRYITRKEN